jgi:UDP-N-acetylglucosamine--N-acetylmuramyl-(pentapeptide) pyrophosphoryl-undecaprenol N-acetylglucosamine transferase
VARAGATTLAELCAIGRASILIPYPFAAEDHQAKNAKALEEQGASICIRESELEVEALGELIGDLLDDVSKRQAMAQAARDHGRPDAAAAIVDDIMGWLAGAEPLSEAPASSRNEPPRGALYSSLAMTPVLRLGCPDVAMRPVPPRPRRPVVVDGALWE